MIIKFMFKIDNGYPDKLVNDQYLLKDENKGGSFKKKKSLEKDYLLQMLKPDFRT